MDTTAKQTRHERFGKKSKQAVRIQWKGGKISEITCERVLLIICYTVWQKQTKSRYSSAGCHSSARRNRQNYDFFGGRMPSEKCKSEHRISKPTLASSVFKSGQVPRAGPKLPPCICDGRQEESWNVRPRWFENQLSPLTQRSSPCVSRQEISKWSQMANELMFILSREKNWGQAKFHCSKAKAQLSWHQQHLSCCWGSLQREVFISQLWISSHETQQGNTGTWQTVCLEKHSPREFLAKESTGCLLYLKDNSSSLQWRQNITTQN